MQSATLLGPDALLRTVAFGPFIFDRASRLLSRDGVELALPPRVLGVLALLLERPGELVTKQELIAAVWRDAFVTETSLAEAVSVLRQTLGDDPQRPTYIQTLHRRGYRFIAELKPAVAERPSPALSVETRVVATIEPEPRLTRLLPWLVALLSLLIAGVAVWRFVTATAPPARQPVRFAVALAGGLRLSPDGSPVAVSRDGSLLAFAACREADCGLYLRPLSQADPTRVAGTGGGASPFFSPDGRWLGFFAGGRLQKIAIGGGSPLTLAEAAEPLGAAWLGDGRIVFARSSGEGLFAVPDRGGPIEALTTPAPGDGHRWPDAVPDAAAVVFTVAGRADSAYAGIVSLRTGGWSRLLDDATAIRAPLPGFLVAQRGADLIATRFDHRSLSLSGLPVTVGTASAAGAPGFALARGGTLVVAAVGGDALHVALDWDGELRRLVPPPAPELPR